MNPEVLVAGETLIDFLPDRPGSLSSVDGFERRPGGAPANVAVALANLERPPLFWTRVGDDPFGTYLLDVLREREVPDRFFERDPEAQTTLAFVTHDDAGDRTFSFYRDGTADTRLRPGTIEDDVLAELEWIHAGGVALAGGSSREATLDLLERAAAAGCTVSFDPNARPELWPDDETFARVVGDALDHVDVLKATAGELEALGFEGAAPDALAAEALDGNPHTAFVTRGSEGATVATTDAAPWSTTPGSIDHCGFDVDVVDTTGAGDAFLAGAIAALVDGRDVAEAVAFANGVAARTTTATGAMTALPSRAAVNDLCRVEPDGR